MALTTPKVKDSYFELVKEFPLRKIRGARQHRQATDIAARFMGRGEVNQGVLDYLDVLTGLIAEYERHAGQTVDTTNVVPADVVRHLMAECGLSISGLAREIGVGQSNLSEMLNGRREWSKAAIRGLAARFALNPLLFLAEPTVRVRRARRSA